MQLLWPCFLGSLVEITVATLVKRCRTYHLVWREAGRQMWRSLGTTDERQARDLLRQFRIRQANRDADRAPGPGEIGFHSFVSGPYQDYAVRKSESTRLTDTYRYRHLSAHFGDRLLTSLTPSDIERYRAARRKDVTAATTNREMDLLRSIFARAVEWGYLSESPAKKIKDYPVQEKPATFLEPHETAALLEASTGYLKVFVALGALAGLRRGEITCLRWDDVDFERGMICVRHSKNYTFRMVPMNTTLKSILERAEKRPTSHDLVLSRPDTGAYRDLRLSLRSALLRAGITRHVRPHDLRHSFASNLIMAGVDIRTVSALLGHRSITTTMRYSHLTQSHLADAVERLSVQCV